MDFGDPLASFRVPTQQQLKMAECVAAYNAGNMDKVARIDEREEGRQKWEVHHRELSKYGANVYKVAFSKDYNPS